MGHLPPFDAARAAETLTRFLASYLRDAKADGYVLGLSGGVDSAVVSALAARAVGPERVLALVLPHRESDPKDAADAARVASAFGVPTETIDVTPVVDAALACAAHPPTRASAANTKARSRMIVLYAHANARNLLVAGTGNKSELLQGYFTKYGDGGADVYPLGDLYKTQVFALARHLGVPEPVVAKPPSAGLWAGQTDEDEMGVRYAELDEILAGFEGGHDVEAVARDLALDAALVEKVAKRVRASEHKRSSLVVPKLSFRTPGLDWRMPRQLR